MGNQEQELEVKKSLKQETKNTEDNSSEEQNQEEQNQSPKTPKEFKNLKEKLYDRIPISLKTLDIIIFALIALLVGIIIYFILRRYY
ncbi:MAG: hypothetical protein K0S76_2894 [Herbinix sp.]|nr:hypothetical protein [Herbinix sp.]